jgi:hypothetical protein
LFIRTKSVRALIDIGGATTLKRLDEYKGIHLAQEM